MEELALQGEVWPQGEVQLPAILFPTQLEPETETEPTSLDAAASPVPEVNLSLLEGPAPAQPRTQPTPDKVVPFEGMEPRQPKAPLTSVLEAERTSSDAAASLESERSREAPAAPTAELRSPDETELMSLDTVAPPEPKAELRVPEASAPLEPMAELTSPEAEESSEPLVELTLPETQLAAQAEAATPQKPETALALGKVLLTPAALSEPETAPEETPLFVVPPEPEAVPENEEDPEQKEKGLTVAVPAAHSASAVPEHALEQELAFVDNRETVEDEVTKLRQELVEAQQRAAAIKETLAAADTVGGAPGLIAVDNEAPQVAASALGNAEAGAVAGTVPRKNLWGMYAATVLCKPRGGCASPTRGARELGKKLREDALKESGPGTLSEASVAGSSVASSCASTMATEGDAEASGSETPVPPTLESEDKSVAALEDVAVEALEPPEVARARERAARARDKAARVVARARVERAAAAAAAAAAVAKAARTRRRLNKKQKAPPAFRQPLHKQSQPGGQPAERPTITRLLVVPMATTAAGLSGATPPRGSCKQKLVTPPSIPCKQLRADVDCDLSRGMGDLEMRAKGMEATGCIGLHSSEDMKRVRTCLS